MSDVHARIGKRREDRGEMPGRSSTVTRVILASSRDEATPLTTFDSMISSSSQISVPEFSSVSSNEDSTRRRTL